MTPADWQALAERFEAADEETVYECVSDLAEAAWWRRDRDKCDALYNVIRVADIPDLLLGVVAACVPEGWEWSTTSFGEARMVAYRHEGRHVRALGGPAYPTRHIPAAALGAAVCRAWAEVAGGKSALTAGLSAEAVERLRAVDAGHEADGRSLSGGKEVAG